jgi:hypothetical protein
MRVLSIYDRTSEHSIIAAAAREVGLEVLHRDPLEGNTYTIVRATDIPKNPTQTHIETMGIVKTPSECMAFLAGFKMGGMK